MTRPQTPTSPLGRLLDKLPMPRRLSLALLVGAAALLLAGAMYATGRRRVFMHGPLIEAHRKLEYRCRDCHAPWAKGAASFNDRCASPACHAKALDTKSTQSDNCIKCHREHQGRGYRPVCAECHRDKIERPSSNPVAKRVARDHYNHEAHAKKAPPDTTCEKCHQPSEDGARYNTPTHADCRQCHAHAADCPPIEEARKKRSKACLHCHLDQDYDGKGEPPPDPHAYVVFSHEPHSQWACTDCHRDIDAVRQTFGRYTQTMQDCQGCHNNDKNNPSKAARDCMACHRAHHRYGRFAEAQKQRGLVQYRDKWLSRDDALKLFGNQTSRALSNLKREDFETARIHFDLAKQVADAIAKSKWANDRSTQKMNRRIDAIAKEFEQTKVAVAKQEKEAEPVEAKVMRKAAKRHINLRPATRTPTHEYLSVSHTYARKIEKAFERLDLESQLYQVDGSAKALYAGVTLRKEVYWELGGLRKAAEEDAVSVIKAIFDGVPDVKEVMVGVESKLGEKLDQQTWDRVLYITATRKAYAKLDFARLTLGDVLKAFTFQYDPRIEKVEPKE